MPPPYYIDNNYEPLIVLRPPPQPLDVIPDMLKMLMQHLWLPAPPLDTLCACSGAPAQATPLDPPPLALPNLVPLPAATAVTIATTAAILANTIGFLL